jgi:hypothetical protein
MMRTLSVSLTCALAIAPVGAISQASPDGGNQLSSAAIPTQFRGEWNSRLKACGTDEWDPLIIDANSLDFSDYAGRVQHIIQHSDRAITVFAKYSSEGHGWDRTNRFVLSRSGNELTIHTPKSVLGRYHRCPVRRPQHRA